MLRLYFYSIIMFFSFCALISCATDDPDGDLINDKDIAVTDELLPDNDSEITDDLIDGDADADKINDEDNDTTGTEDDTEFVDEIADPDLENDEDNDTEPEICADICLAGTVSIEGTCSLWDDLNKVWIDNIQDGEGNLHNRARNFATLLHEKMMPYGGVFRTYFTDSTYTVPFVRGGNRDSVIWLSNYIASEAFRYMATKAPDARRNMEESVRTLDLWWRITANKGYLVRYAAPSDAPEDIQKIFSEDIMENHKNFLFESKSWHWKGDTSRDQYQGAFFGYTMAYEATENEEIKEMIRKSVVDTVEQLMEKQTRTIVFEINGNIPVPTQVEIQYAIFNSHESESGNATVKINIDPFEQDDDGMLTFWPNPSIYIRKVPGFSWVPDILMRSQAIQLAAMFRTALQVTDGIPEYALRRQAIFDHYNSMYFEWSGMAEGWAETNNCGDSYHGLNIAFLPVFNWVKLEDDPVKKSFLQTNVLKNRMWSAVENHKNVFFAYIYTSQANPYENTASVIASHTDQLRQFPSPPLISIDTDNTGKYEENPSCEGLSKTAIDVKDRVRAGFLWEKNPWKLKEAAEPNMLYPGVDYLIAYWMARYYGYLQDDAPNTCLRWKK